MEKLFASLKIEYWYHVFIIMGAVGAILAMTMELKGIANAHALLIALGMFFAGLGEWINHPLQTKLYAPNAYMRGGGITTSHPRSNSFIGCVFVLLGVVLIGVAIYKIANAG